jgi:hypothetical protein
MDMKIVCNGKSITLETAIEDVIDDYFNGDEDFITFFTMAMKDYVARETLKE